MVRVKQTFSINADLLIKLKALSSKTDIPQSKLIDRAIELLLASESRK